MRHTNLWVALCAVAGTITLANLGAAAPENAAQLPRLSGGAAAKAHPAQGRAMREAAEKAYMATQAAFGTDTAPLSEVFAWSRRWMEAERNLAENKEKELAALNDHVNRMKGLHAMIHVLHNNGAKGGEEELMRASEYHLAEAELWFLSAGGKLAKAK